MHTLRNLSTLLLCLLVACSSNDNPSSENGPLELDQSTRPLDMNQSLAEMSIASDMRPSGGDMIQARDASSQDASSDKEMSNGADMTAQLDMAQASPDMAVAPDMAPDPRDGPGEFVAVGWRETIVSFDHTGKLLHAQDLPNEEQYNKSLLLRGVGVGPEGFVVVGDKIIRTSKDGITWEANVKPEGGTWVSEVAYGNGRYVAAGGTGALWSIDGKTWTLSKVKFGKSVRSMTFGQGVFVAVGDGGLRARSTDGETWTDVVLDDSPTLSSVRFGDGVFLAVGAQGRRITSKNGQIWENEVRWTQDEIDANKGLGLTGAVWAKNRWVVVGRKQLYTSPDALPQNWTKHDTKTYFTGVSYGGGRYMATAGRNVSASEDGITWKNVLTEGSSFWNIVFRPN